MTARLIIDNTRPRIVQGARGEFEYAPVDYPIGIRFVPHVPAPTPMFTGSELLWSCFFSGLVSMLFTCGMALVLAS